MQDWINSQRLLQRILGSYQRDCPKKFRGQFASFARQSQDLISAFQALEGEARQMLAREQSTSNNNRNTNANPDPGAEIEIRRLQDARIEFNRITIYYLDLMNSTSDFQLKEKYRLQALSAGQSRDEATYKLASLLASTERHDLAIPLLQEVINSQGESPLTKRARQLLTRSLNEANSNDRTPSSVVTLGTGDVQVTLRWDSFDDLDLKVTDPNGETIFYQNSSARLSGGELDVDANRGCTADHGRNPVENIYWPQGNAPYGEYKVEVILYQACEGLGRPIDFSLDILVQGEAVTKYNGTVTGRKNQETLYTNTFVNNTPQEEQNPLPPNLADELNQAMGADSQPGQDESGSAHKEIRIVNSCTTDIHVAVGYRETRGTDDPLDDLQPEPLDLAAINSQERHIVTYSSRDGKRKSKTTSKKIYVYAFTDAGRDGIRRYWSGIPSPEQRDPQKQQENPKIIEADVRKIPGDIWSREKTIGRETVLGKRLLIRVPESKVRDSSDGKAFVIEFCNRTNVLGGRGPGIDHNFRGNPILFSNYCSFDIDLKLLYSTLDGRERTRGSLNRGTQYGSLQAESYLFTTDGQIQILARKNSDRKLLAVVVSREKSEIANVKRTSQGSPIRERVRGSSERYYRLDVPRFEPRTSHFQRRSLNFTFYHVQFCQPDLNATGERPRKGRPPQ